MPAATAVVCKKCPWLSSYLDAQLWWRVLTTRTSRPGNSACDQSAAMVTVCQHLGQCATSILARWLLLLLVLLLLTLSIWMKETVR